MEPSPSSTSRRATADAMDKIRELISDIEVAMLTTTTADESLRSRPMGTVLDHEAAVVWLFVSADSHTAAEIKDHPRIALAFADPERDRYVSISGRAEFVQERERKRALWRTEFEKWFPGGPDDRDLSLVRVPMEQAEYWDDSAKLMRTFYETVGAPYSGVPPEAVGEHAQVRPR